MKRKYVVSNLRDLKAAVSKLKQEDRLVITLLPPRSKATIQLILQAKDTNIFLRGLKGFTTPEK